MFEVLNKGKARQGKSSFYNSAKLKNMDRNKRYKKLQLNYSWLQWVHKACDQSTVWTCYAACFNQAGSKSLLMLLVKAIYISLPFYSVYFRHRIKGTRPNLICYQVENGS